jgi:glyoxylase-like metal-dependent hydrolase (beta-lactamase superfamily II)
VLVGVKKRTNALTDQQSNQSAIFVISWFSPVDKGAHKSYDIITDVNKIIKINDRIYFFSRLVPSSNTTLIKGKANILIDPGYSPFRKASTLEPLVKEAGIKIKDIDEIWFTHNHPDHTGLSYYLLQEKQIRIVCNPLAKKFLEWEPPLRGLTETEKIDGSILRRIYPTHVKKRKRLASLVRNMVNFYGRPLSIGSHAIKVDDCFSPGESRYGINVLFLPGHTPDEVGFSLGSTLITGDLIATFSFKRPAVLNVPSSDIDDAISSLKKIMEISPKLILPGHGNCKKIDTKLINEIYRQTVELREKGIRLVKNSHSFIPYALGLQKILPFFTIRLQERLALLLIIYKSYVKTN